MSEKPTHSTRFTRAARAERERLLRRRRRSAEQVRRIEEELAAARADLEGIDARLDGLRSFTDEPPELHAAPSGQRAGEMLRGAAIRRHAVELLRGDWQGGPIHYRRWLELLEASGFEVDGKRPDAVFLGQITRSPVVRATTSAGFYEIDEDAPRRLGDEIAAIEGRLGEIGAQPSLDPAKLEENMSRREELTGELRRVERELKEAVLALTPAEEPLAA